MQVALSKAKTGMTVRFHRERLADADAGAGAGERGRQRAHWSAVLDRLFG